MAAEMKLTYFNLRGRAEPTRLLFKLAGRSFIDNRISADDWPAFKSKTPKGQLPILEVDGKVLCESGAIARFVARELKLCGSTNWETAICDMLADTAGPVLEPAVRYRYATSEEVKADAVKEVEKELLVLEKLLTSLKVGKFVLGDEVSAADSTMYCVVEYLESTMPQLSLHSCPTLTAVAKEFAEIPQIAEWIKTRPETSS